MRPSNGLELQTGCRLHFGLMEVARDALACYAGLGVMLEAPAMTLRLLGLHSPDRSIDQIQIRAVEPFAPRVKAILRHWRDCNPTAWLPSQVEVLNPLPPHHGLGSGTQFACALTAALQLFTEPPTDVTTDRWQACTSALFLERQSPEEQLRWLSQHAGRGLRSAIGLQGFLSGGLILDHGLSRDRAKGDSPLPIDNRDFSTEVTWLPQQWRVVLIIPRTQNTVCGQHEASLIDRLATASNPNRGIMLESALEVMQCSRAGDFAAFTTALDQFTNLAGQLFSDVQGGSFSAPEVENVVHSAMGAGLSGVGQSSWGPAVFGFTETPEAAEVAVQSLRSENRLTDASILISSPARGPAKFRFLKGL